MLLQPRTFALLQLPDRQPGPRRSAAQHHAPSPPPAPHQQQQQQPGAYPARESSDFSFFEQPRRAYELAQEQRAARRMLLAHQAGSVKVGQVVRYTLTYTPAHDRVLPTPAHLHVKVKNTAAIPLRAAWVHGPYALHVAAYPASFNPHRKADASAADDDGVPAYEPMVKAGGSWSAELCVPAGLRQTGRDLPAAGKGAAARVRGEHDGGDGRAEEQSQEAGSVTWIIEIASQILFSNSASVGFEVLVGRDQKSLELGFAAVAGHRQGGPGQVPEQRTDESRKKAQHRGSLQTDGVYSRALTLRVEDTQALWDKPALPSWEDVEEEKKGKKTMPEDANGAAGNNSTDSPQTRKRKRVHLVVVTHGLHSNVGADLLFLKESIDATVKQARIDAKKRRQNYRASQQAEPSPNGVGGSRETNGDGAQDASTAPLSGGQEDLENTVYDSDDDEETIVRGFPGNAVKTENGIQYLGKRLAKWVMRTTYPDQPFMPVKKKFSRTITDTFRSDAEKAKRDGKPAHQGSSIHHPAGQVHVQERPYQFTSISFVGHSLGGLIQTYAIAYIQKHSPTFFQVIQPINFVALAAPMLGLSNENPMYVKFALDFGLVGRTGQDLGLTWRPPGFTKSSWNTMIGGLGMGAKDKDAQQPDPGSKPLLRILPNGHAHHVLRLFRNRTLYSNVVNDGIVPLRTSCLLFLDWRGLGKVEKARRENGLLGTVAEWGWAELTGVNSSTVKPNVLAEQYGDSDEEDNDDEHVRKGEGEIVPQPADNETVEDSKRPTNRLSYEDESDVQKERLGSSASTSSRQASTSSKGVFDPFFSLFRTKSAEKSAATSPPQSKKTTKALRRGQIVHQGSDELPDEEEAHGQEVTTPTTPNPTIRPQMPHMHTGQTKERSSQSKKPTNLEDVLAPPTTSIFESAGDILHPPLPSRQWITDPSTRKRTIFHDRVYHPEDIPPPPRRRQGTILSRSFSSDKLPIFSSSKKSAEADSSTAGSSGMKIEEKIARDYHRDLSWRKVLVRLEPDAHNNIIVRRMFANAYGWPVVKHLCDTHFADTYSARTRDEEEPARERAKPMDSPIDAKVGEEVDGQTRNVLPHRTGSETREERDELAALSVSRDGALGSYSSATGDLASRSDTGSWDDAVFDDGSDAEDSDAAPADGDDRGFVQRLMHPHAGTAPTLNTQAVAHGAGSVSVSPLDGHRGLAPVSPGSTRSGKHAGGLGSSGSPSIANGAELTHVTSRPFVQEPKPAHTRPASPGSVAAEVGLRKSVDEVIANSHPSPANASAEQ